MLPGLAIAELEVLADLVDVSELGRRWPDITAAAIAELEVLADPTRSTEFGGRWPDITAAAIGIALDRLCVSDKVCKRVAEAARNPVLRGVG
jgi:hypothetical protein